MEGVLISPPPGLDPDIGKGADGPVTLVLDPAVAAVVREALAAEAASGGSGWSDADIEAMELVIAAIEATGIRGCL